MTNLLPSKRSPIPGDSERTLTRSARSTDGRAWPAGTRYQPAGAGEDNVHGHRVVNVTVLPSGEHVSFAVPQEAI